MAKDGLFSEADKIMYFIRFFIAVLSILSHKNFLWHLQECIKDDQI